MRRKREHQRPLSGLWPDHRLAQELRAVSKILDDNPSILELVLHDLCDTGSSGQGAPWSLRRAGAALGPPQKLASAVLRQVGVSLERLPKFPSLRPPALPLVPQRLLPAGEHQPHPSLHLGTDQPAPGRLGRPPGTGTGPQDSSRCHRGGKSHPVSDRFPVAVRRDSGPHSNPSPVVPASQDRLPRSPAPRQAALYEHPKPPRRKRRQQAYRDLLKVARKTAHYTRIAAAASSPVDGSPQSGQGRETAPLPWT